MGMGITGLPKDLGHPMHESVCVSAALAGFVF